MRLHTDRGHGADLPGFSDSRLITAQFFLCFLLIATLPENLFAQVPPGKATLVSPSGSATTNLPTYTWNAVSGSTWYYLWVNDSGASPRINTWYTAAPAGCPSGTGTCSVTPSTALASGSCQWWIQTWNDFGYGPCSDPLTFVT